MKTSILVAILILVASVGRAQSPNVTQGLAILQDAYTDTTIHGWKIHINSALDEHPSLRARAALALSDELTAIETRLPVPAVTELKEMSFWLEWVSKNGKVLQYHYSADDLRKHDDDPRKESSIEILAADYVNMPHDSLPLVKMLALGYQHRALGLHNTDVDRAFQHAKAAKMYDVQIDSRQHFPFRDDKEYFAILSNAYFGGPLSYAPFDKKRFKLLDSQGYDMIEKMWKVK